MAPPKKKKKKKKQKKRKDKSKTKKKTVMNPSSKSGSPKNGSGERKRLKGEREWWEAFSLRLSTSSFAISDEEEVMFKHFFRVSRKTFTYICSLVREDLISRPPSGLINIEGRLLSVEKQVAIALRRLASGDSQVSVGEAFAVGQSTVSQVTWRFIESLEERGRHHLYWPNAKEMCDIKERFESSFGLPNCCGAMDTTHIVMTLPAVETSEEWCDINKNYSMFLQAVVDSKLRFLDIVTGWPGRMTVPQLLKFSGLYKLSESGEKLNGETCVCADGHLIREYVVGNSAYPLLPWLITPFRGNDISPAMLSFNAKHEQAVTLAENALLLLKSGWRILHKIMWRPDKHKLPSIILVCCLLHNIIIDNGDIVESDVILSDHHDPGYTQECCFDEDVQGQAMRENLMNIVTIR